MLTMSQAKSETVCFPLRDFWETFSRCLPDEERRLRSAVRDHERLGLVHNLGALCEVLCARLLKSVGAGCEPTLEVRLSRAKLAQKSNLHAAHALFFGEESSTGRRARLRHETELQRTMVELGRLDDLFEAETAAAVAARAMAQSTGGRWLIDDDVVECLAADVALWRLVLLRVDLEEHKACSLIAGRWRLYASRRPRSAVRLQSWWRGSWTTRLTCHEALFHAARMALRGEHRDLAARIAPAQRFIRRVRLARRARRLQWCWRRRVQARTTVRRGLIEQWLRSASLSAKWRELAVDWSSRCELTQLQGALKARNAAERRALPKLQKLLPGVTTVEVLEVLETASSWTERVVSQLRSLRVKRMIAGVALCDDSALFLDDEGRCYEIGLEKRLLKIKVRSIACGESFSAVVDDSGGVWTWGANGLALGHGDGAPRRDPTMIAKYSSCDAVACGADFVCARNKTHYLEAWGAGIGRSPRRVAASLLGRHGGLAEVACGASHALMLAGDGSCLAWDLRKRRKRPTMPTLVILPKKAVKVAAGPYGVCLAKTKGGHLYEWRSDRKSPIRLVFEEQVIDCAVGPKACLALDSDGGLWTWQPNSSNPPKRTSHAPPDHGEQHRGVRCVASNLIALTLLSSSAGA